VALVRQKNLILMQDVPTGTVRISEAARQMPEPANNQKSGTTGFHNDIRAGDVWL
jgi:hypothetical protein